MEKQPDKQKETEDARRLKAIFEHSQDRIITIDMRGLVESINPAAAKLFGYTPSEVIGNNIKMLMPEPYHSEHDGYLGNFHQTGHKKIIGIGREVTGKRKDDSEFPFFLSVSEVQLDDRKIFTGFIHDISEMRNKEAELVKSRKQFEAIFETAVDSIIIIGKRGIIKLVNPAVTKLFGYESTEMVGQNIKMLMPEPYHSEHDGYLHNYNTTHKRKIIGIGRQVQGKKKDGTVFPLRLGVSEVKSPEGSLFTGIIHDLTEQQQKEDKIKELNQNLELKVSNRTQELSSTVNKLLSLNKQLEHEVIERKKAEESLRQSELELLQTIEKEKQLNELKSRFVSMASHEFRTPLSTVLSSVSLIGRYTEGAQQDKRDKHIKRIKSAVSNLTDILNDFLSLSKLEEGKEEVHPETFLLKDLCTLVIDEMQGLLKTGQQIQVSTEHENITVHLDKRLIKNILFNLISNAIKYSGEGKTIYCSAKTEDRQLSITIRDEGIGIPESDIEHLFGRFFRATNSINIQGTGLGLNIVKKYLDLMNGDISFKSKEGEGSSFTFVIPNAIT